MARDHNAYTVRPWVLWESRDPLRATHARADLDAVIVETPYERVRYEAYLQVLQGLPMDAVRIREWRAAANGHTGFIIYAHSATGDEREAHFLARFSSATFTAGGRPLTPAERTTFGPSEDFYDVGTFREERYTGALTYRFADTPGACPRRGTLQFRDANGRPYAFAVDFRRYR